MPNYNRAELDRTARKYGFVRDTFEKVLRLTEILKYINEEPFLKNHLILKGGTAINLFIFELPRLSVDIDLDYTPNDTRENMLSARTKITDLIKTYMAEQGYVLSESSRFNFSLDAFYYQYINAGGNRDMIKLELNYSLRAHILDPVCRRLTTDAFHCDAEIQILNPIEIFAAKGNALISRAAARDLYDWGNMIETDMFIEERNLFRKCFVFYATISAEKVNESFDTSAIDQLTFAKIRRDLFPVLNKKDNFDLEGRKQTAKNYISELMVLNEEERAYIESFICGEYRPDLLFDDKEILERIADHPMAIWKTKRNGDEK